MKLKNKVFGLTDVSQHNNCKDCWVIINARVYDVTNFLNDHPGGDKVLLDVAGKDASDEFEEAGHGSAARLMLDEYYIGEIDLVKTPCPIFKITTPKVESYAKNQTIVKKDKRLGLDFSLKSIGLLVPLILGVAVIFSSFLLAIK